jgi:Stress up-regulated Nod 19
VTLSARKTATLGSLGLALALVFLVPGPATARTRTLHLRYGPITMRPAELIAHNTRVPAPRVDGFITRMHAFAVDAQGRALASDEVMLHHAVFRRDITPYYDRDCQARRDTEPFYATGEEDETLRLPSGYGLRVKRSDSWLVRWMLMNHTDNRHRVYIRYDVRVETSRAIVPVRALWMRVVSCRNEYFDVPGNGGPGSVFEQSRELPVSRTGRIVVATGHLHGGAIGLTLSEPRCGSRALVTTRPVYRSGVPAPHDGPVQVTSFSSPIGIPVFRGQRLWLTATYDNSAPHDQVMGTLHLYVAAGRPAAFDCGPLPSNTNHSQ